MKIIATTSLALGLMYSLSFNAQTKSVKQVEVKQTVKVEESVKGTQIKQLDATPQLGGKSVIVNSSTKNVRTPIRSNARVSDYFSLEKEIIKRSVSGKIPESLPKHKDGQTKEVYTQILKEWAKKNLHLIKKEFHSEYK